MFDALIQLSFFTAKALIVIIMILILLAGIIALLSRGKEKKQGKITIKNLKDCYSDVKETLLEVTMSKKAFKKFQKEEKALLKKADKTDEEEKSNVFVINFNGDMKASQVTALREEVTAILGIAKSSDEVFLRLESPGGMVHAYGLAAAQLLRLRDHHIPLIVSVDKVAASGGYLMAAIANKIMAAPFAIVGSIGVIFQLPNFNRLLKEKNIDFEQITAGNFKRTLTVFGENTEEGREKLHQEMEDIHRIFKNVVHEYRSHLDIEKVATGEHWLAKQAIEFNLVDEIKTSDDYLLEKSKTSNIYEITYHIKKSFSEKLFGGSSSSLKNLLTGYISSPLK